MDNIKFGKLIKKLRIENNLTQSELRRYSSCY